jgi:predicted HAD superfamily Cof-like phosphohydrolase
MRLAGQEVPTKPIMPDEHTRRLRAKLILEEAFETIEGLGFKLTNSADPVAAFFNYCEKVEPNLIETIDGCCDIKVVTTGTLSACGLPDDPFQVEVDLNNLAKFGPGHSRRSDGKLIKPPDFKGPDIAGILKSITEP